MQPRWYLDERTMRTNRDNFFAIRTYDSEIKMISKGDICKLVLIDTYNPPKLWSGWFEVTSIHKDEFTGRIPVPKKYPNLPKFLNQKNSLTFKGEHILYVLGKTIKKPLWFHNECLVSSKVIENFKIGYIKKIASLSYNRNTEKFDSGWCIYEGSEDESFEKNHKTFEKADLGYLLKIDESIACVLNDEGFDSYKKINSEWRPVI